MSATHQNAPYKNRLARPLAFGTLVLAVVAVGAAIYITGTPMQQRHARIDERRTRELRDLQHQVYAYANVHDDTWPASVEALARPGVRIDAHDPETGAPYEYRVIDATTFALCATFATDSAQVGSEYRPDDDWAHGVGRQCFERKAREKKHGTATTAADLAAAAADAAEADAAAAAIDTDTGP